MPSMSQKSYNKRVQILNSFKEREYKQGAILEHEGEEASNVYLILKGEVSLMKRPENLYDKKTGKQFKPFTYLQCVVDPSDSG